MKGKINERIKGCGDNNSVLVISSNYQSAKIYIYLCVADLIHWIHSIF